MNNIEFCKYISEIAIKSMLQEVSATPKPGLVDRNNPGAHKDMDFFTFMDSCTSLVFTFYDCASEGYRFANPDYTQLLRKIRPIGIKGEDKMFRTTNDVNTHKGLIFSLGIIAAATALEYKINKTIPMDTYNICEIIEGMTKGIVKKELQSLEGKASLTYGEKLFKEYGIKGIRGEVESGFPTVRSNGLPIFRKLMEDNKSNINDNLVQVLLHLMAVTEDVNILGRHSIKELEYVKSEAKRALSLGGIFTAKGRNKVLSMDKDFIEKNISPGGSADLLAVTLMFYYLETNQSIK